MVRITIRLIKLHCRSEKIDGCQPSRRIPRLHQGIDAGTLHLVARAWCFHRNSGLLFRIKACHHATTSPPPTVAYDLVSLRNHRCRKLLCRWNAASVTVPSTSSYICRRRNRGRRGRPPEEAETPRGRPRDQGRHRQLQPSQR